MKLLRFSPENAKIRHLKDIKELKPFLGSGRKIYSIDLLSGHYCPFADKCLSKAVYVAGKGHIEDGPNTEFRCYSASQEAQYPNVYKARKYNSDLLLKAKTSENMYSLLLKSVPKNAGIIRIHTAGDFFNQAHFNAWLEFAKNTPEVLCYAYTKSLPYWLKRRKTIDKVENFVLTASYGGKHDDLIPKEGLRSAMVVYNKDTIALAAKLGLEYDHDDSHAANPSIRDMDFALWVHGTQPPGSEAAETKKQLNGVGSYNRKD